MKQNRTPLIIAVIAAMSLGAVALVGDAVGQDKPDEPTPSFMIVDAGPETGTAAEVPDPAEGSSSVEPGSDEDLTAKYEALKEAYENREADARMVVGVAGIVAALVWLILAGIKRMSSVTDKWKHLIPKIVAGLGVIGGLAAELALGIPWWSALVVGAGPPLAVFLHEFIKKAPKVE